MRFLSEAASNYLAVIVLSVLFWGASAKADEPVPVKVGAYEYGVIYFYENGQPKGIVPELIRLLNELQDDYAFTLVETSSRRRYQDLMTGQFDMVLLDSAKWEWQELDVRFSDRIFTESDLYVALAGVADPQLLFSDVTRYSILCVLGFHYHFADFNADPEFLNQNFDVLLRYKEEDVLDGLLAGEAPIAVVSAGFLAAKLEEQPSLSDSLLVSQTPDAQYDLVSVLSHNAPIPLEYFNQLITKLKNSGEAEVFWQQRHLGLTG